MLFELNRGQVPEGGMERFRVVPVDPAGDLPFDGSTVGPGGSAVVDGFGFNRPMVDSHRALSSASPTVPMDPVMPCSRSSAVKATDVYPTRRCVTPPPVGASVIPLASTVHADNRATATGSVHGNPRRRTSARAHTNA